MTNSLDEARIFVKAGKGGNGSSSFLKTRYNAMGGPDGGNGGNGGNVIIKANQNINTLIFFQHQRIFHAPNGENGSKEKRHGKSGSNLTIEVPVGTQVIDSKTEKTVIDLTEHNQTFTLCKGGKGGMGNVIYKTSTNRAPRKATSGKEGEEGLFAISVESLGDIGLLGLPNSGKSSLLAQTSNAKVKVGDYQFTTTRPQLGFVEVENFDGFTMIDIPGLIENASQGAGMGYKFLKHIKRCKALLHIVDISSKNPIEDWRKISQEVKQYQGNLVDKIKFIALNKVDLLDKEEIKRITAQFKKVAKLPIYKISAKNKTDLEKLKKDLFYYIKNEQ